MVFDNQKGAKEKIVGFKEDFENINKFLRKACVKTSRKNDRCHRCFNDVLWEENQKSDTEQKYKMLHRVHDVRFTSLADEIKNLKLAKPVIQKIQMDKGPHFELVQGIYTFEIFIPFSQNFYPVFIKIFIPFFQNFYPVFLDFNINWELVSEMDSICDQVIPHLKVFEKSNDYTMSQYVPRLFQILNWALDENNVVDEDGICSTNIVELKEVLSDVMIKYIFGTSRIEMRISDLAILGYYFDYEQSAMQFNETMELAKNAKTTLYDRFCFGNRTNIVSHDYSKLP